MSAFPCIDPETSPGRRAHAWENTGLDQRIDGVLCSTRRCVWCGKRQEKPYGIGGRSAWIAAQDGTT